MAVLRCFTEKKPGYDGDARALQRELTEILGVAGLTGVRIFCRYDMEGVDAETYRRARPVVFSEPPCDVTIRISIRRSPGSTAWWRWSRCPGSTISGPIPAPSAFN